MEQKVESPEVPTLDISVVAEWHNSMVRLKALKLEEAELRKKVISYFPAPVEGTNKLDLGDGHSIKLTHKLTRNIDEAALIERTEEMESQGIPLDMLIRRKPELAKSVYNKLPKAALQLFDQLLIVRPASGSIEIVKNPKGK